ncbi:MAG TPA: uroporphyrinogen-III synthase [Thermoanaerobaculia bacterium]|nr:uroporphyrinogen-III synthase [Thermoanaerobaculia bacterium]
MPGPIMAVNGQLGGVRVVVTRAAHQAARLTAALSAAGAAVAALPLLEVVPPADRGPLERAAGEIESYDWLVFTSVNAVEAFMPLVAGALPRRLRVAAVGAATAAALRRHGVEPDLMTGGPAAIGAMGAMGAIGATGAGAEGDEVGAMGLLAALTPLVGGARKVLLPQAADARPFLVDGLVAAGAKPVGVVAYDKRLPADAACRAAELFAVPPIGWVTFTSPRVARHFASLFAADWERRRAEVRAASIGAVTSAELRRLGVEPAAEAARPGDRELVEALIAALARPP